MFEINIKSRFNLPQSALRVLLSRSPTLPAHHPQQDKPGGPTYLPGLGEEGREAAGDHQMLSLSLPVVPWLSICMT